MTKCGRCDGKGKLEAYKHILSGVCFKCWGSGDEANPNPAPSQRKIETLTIDEFRKTDPFGAACLEERFPELYDQEE